MAKPASHQAAKQRRQSGAQARTTPDGFWDRPELMGLVADLLFIAAAAALSYSAVLAVARLPFFPLREVVVENAPSQVSRAQIEFAAKNSLAGNFFTVDLDAVRATLEKQYWVRHASVRRLWPDGVALSVEEHVAAARWHTAGDQAEAQLVNDHGELFAAPVAPEQQNLPLFAGPEGSAALVLTRYHDFSALLAPLARVPRTIALSPRQAWTLHLDDGLLLELGRDQPKHPIEERLARFVGAYAQVKTQFSSAIGAIDMRYPNGFALRQRVKT